MTMFCIFFVCIFSQKWPPAVTDFFTVANSGLAVFPLSVIQEWILVFYFSKTNGDFQHYRMRSHQHQH